MSDDEPDIEIRVAHLVAALKGLVYEMGMPVIVNTEDERLKHMNLWANEMSEGVWLFYLKPKAEADEDGAVGHA